ncbi:MAG TPA: nucleotidyltransferase family protein [Anaerolineales bacterium]
MISAIILAAGRSKRMGQPKMLLPWGKITVIEQVITTFRAAGIGDILIVTGGAHAEVKKVIDPYRIRQVYNTDYADGEMLSSLQCGIGAMSEHVQAALVSLGDQPQLQEASVLAICDAHRANRSGLVVPSFQMRRGHPWLVARSYWDEILSLKPPETTRDFLNRHAGEIQYVELDTPTILADLDTPEDYRASHP